jgi:hypothetical protein
MVSMQFELGKDDSGCGPSLHAGSRRTGNPRYFMIVGCQCRDSCRAALFGDGTGKIALVHALTIHSLAL